MRRALVFGLLLLVSLLAGRGHALTTSERQGAAEVIVYNQKEDVLEGGVDRRAPDGAAGPVTNPPIRNRAGR